MTREDDITTDDTADELTETDRDLAMLREVIEECHRKITSGRIRDRKNERIRLQQYRALAYLCQTSSQLRQSKELDALAERLDALEAAVNADDADADTAWWTSAPAEVSE